MSDNKILIILPGITGSTLIKASALDPVWPTQVLTEAKINNLDNVKTLLEDSSLYSGGPILKEIESNSTYQDLQDYFCPLDKNGTYTWFYPEKYMNINQLDKNNLPDKLYVNFGYDWRESNSKSAISLSDTIENIIGKYEDCQIYLVGHSMGGLVARYYLESGEFSTKEGFNSVMALITLGTPHLGSPLALNAIIGGVQAVHSIYLGDDVQKFVNDQNFPSAYELLPPEYNDIPHKYVVDSEMNEYGVFDKNSPLYTCLKNKYNACDQNFDHNQIFYKNELNHPITSTIPYYLVVGIDSDYEEILGYVFDTKYLEDNNSNPITPQNGVTGKGDGIVPTYSASIDDTNAGNITSHNFEKPSDFDKNMAYHLTLPSDPNIQTQVAQWIGEKK